MAISSIAFAELCQDCSGYNDTFGGTQPIADPSDCHRFYLCASQTEISDTSFPCFDDLMYDYIDEVCKEPDDPTLECAPPCEQCTLSCFYSYFGKAADDTNCDVYYECDEAGVPIDVIFCEESAPYFDGLTCQTDISKCCTCGPDACLEGDLTEIPDKRNCTNYYVCAAPGIPDERFHVHCESGNFDVEQQACVEGADCDDAWCVEGSGELLFC